MIQPDLRHLLLIGAYRDNEVNSSHPLVRKLDAIKAAGGKVEEITLVPLAPEHLGQLIGDALRCELQRAAPLAKLVHEKTGGNPFFAIQFLSHLAEESLLSFDHDAASWSWDPARIHAKGCTDNAVELMTGKLQRLPAETLNVLRHFACLGNSARVKTLSAVLGTSEDEVHAALWPAVSQELVWRLDGAYRFSHDRVQEAAYSSVPEAQRAEAHLRIGKLLAAQTPPEKREESIFEIAGQLNRGAGLITSQEEREQLAEFNLIAGKRAKGSTAFTSALSYLIAGAALLAEDSWERRYELAFQLDLQRAECEFLTGELAAAEERLMGVSDRALNLVDLAAVTCLQEDLFTTTGRSDCSVEVALDYLRRVGIEWKAHPVKDEVKREYERFWQQLGDRPIEALLDLSEATAPLYRATMDVLTAVVAPALFTDQNLYCLVIGRMANLALERGNIDGSCYAYALLGSVLGPQFGNFNAGFQFGNLAVELVEKRGLDRFKARVYMMAGNHIVPWTKPIRTGRGLVRGAITAAQGAGDLTYAAYSGTHFVTHLLASGDPLPDVQREAEAALDFARKARFGLVFDRITGKLQLIRTLRGLTPIFGAFDDAEFDESRFERHLEEDPRLALAACWYWIHKLQARFFAGANDDATLASANAERLLWTSPTVFERAEYHFYAALARAAFCNAASAAERIKQLEALSAHHRQLEEWAKNCPENFESRAALAGAEIAWIEGRVLEAMDLYEQAIRSARASGFVQNEALANELAARFYGARGFETISQTYLRNARHCYLRWGANGKVRQLDHFYPQLRDEPPVAGPTGTIEAPVEQLDLATVIKVSQAVSGEIVPEKLIDTIMRTAMAQAGAVRALLILTRGDEQRIAAEASADGDAVSLCQRDEAVSGATLPEAVLRYVLRTRECIILDDAAAEPRFVADPYIRQHKARSILCLPLINQAKLIGVLYLENNLAPRVFAPARIAVLKLLASQAAITLENAHLYLGLAEREAKIRRLVDSNIIGSFTFQVPSDGPDTGDPAFGEVNDAFLRMLGYDREEFASCCRRRSELTPPEWRDRDKRTISELREFGVVQPFEKEYFRKDGSRLPVLAGFASFDETRTHGVAFVLDLTGRKRAEKELRTLAEERALLEDALNHSHEGAYINDSAGRFLYVNDEACRALGYSREELLALCVPDIDPNYPAERVALTLRETREKGPVTIETRHRRKDGRIFPVELTLSAFDYGGKNYYIALARDITERKRVEGELRTLAEQRAIMEGALNQSHEGAYLIDGEAHFLYVNDEACRALGYSRAELLAMRVPDIDPDYPVERYKAVFEDVLKNRPVAFETKHRRKDGRTFPVEITGSAFKYAEKDYFIALARNITERKRTENALRRSEAYLAEAQRLTRMGSWASDGASREPIYWSEEMFRLYGLDPQSGLPPQDPAMTLVHPEDRDKLEQASDSVFVGKADLDVEFRIVLSDGAIKYIHALAHPVVDANGQVVEVVGTLADITERKRTEEALRRSEAYLAEAQKLTRTGSWAWDPCRDWILHCSEEIFRIYGIDPRHGMPAFEMLMQRVHPDDHDRIIESTLEGARKKEERLIQYRIVLPDGTLKYIESVRRPVLDAAGNVVEIVGTSIDVTERKRDEEERERLRKLEADLAHVDRISMLGELAASLAHEIKQPITGAVTSANACLRWLARHPPDLEKARAAALRIERDGTRAAEVINRLRAFYKKDTPAQRGLIDVNAVIREMIALLHSEAIQHSISIRHELADCIPRIIADRVQLQQVLMNLMLNAIEAMRGTDRELTIRSRLHADDQLLISVGDTGVGFPAEDAEYIFDPFFTTKPQGTGMGLAITRSLVESHGGRVWATPNTGPGATFYFTLPIRDKANE